MADMTTISLALSTLKNATDIATFFRNSDLNFEKAESKMKVADLMSALADLKMQLAELQQSQLDRDYKIRELEEQLNLRSRLTYEAPYYWLNENGKKDGPFCQQCKDNGNKLIRLQDHKEGSWWCTTCQNGFHDSRYRPRTVNALGEW